MPTQQTAFSHRVYRDFALITLAAIGVGLLFSLTIATAIVLANPNRDAPAQAAPVSQAKGPQKTRLALQHGHMAALQAIS